MSVSKALRFEVLRRDKFTCRYCGHTASEAELHVDHLHPRTLGGADTLDNLVTACKDCNVGKAGRLDVAIRGLIQKPLQRSDDDDSDKMTLAHYDMPPLDLQEQLADVFKHDTMWCSDGSGRREFFSALGVNDDDEIERAKREGRMTDVNKVKQEEDWCREILRKIPFTERWVVERRTGLWHGTVYSREFGDIGGEIGESAAHARELYDRAIVRMGRLLGLEKA